MVIFISVYCKCKLGCLLLQPISECFPNEFRQRGTGCSDFVIENGTRRKRLVSTDDDSQLLLYFALLKNNILASYFKGNPIQNRTIIDFSARLMITGEWNLQGLTEGLRILKRRWRTEADAGRWTSLFHHIKTRLTVNHSGLQERPVNRISFSI